MDIARRLLLLNKHTFSAILNYLLLAAFVAGITACVPGRVQVAAQKVRPEAVEETVVVGFSNGFTDNSWRAELMASMRQEALRHSDLELLVRDGRGDINKQIQDIESFIALKVDAIILIPNSSIAVTPSLKKARKLGIKVLHCNLPLEDSDSYDVYIGPDERERGRKWASWLQNKIGGSGSIVMLGGIPGNPGTAMAMKGALEVIDSSSIRILAYRDAYWQEDRAYEIMSGLLKDHKHIDGIWADGGQVAAGALKALLDAGHPLVPVTGDDYNGLFKLYLKYKDQYPDFDFAAISTPTWQGMTVLRSAVRLVRGEKLDSWMKLDPQLLTGEDAVSYAKPELSDIIFVDSDLPYSLLKEIR